MFFALRSLESNIGLVIKKSNLPDPQYEFSQ